MNAPENAPNAFRATQATCPVCRHEFEPKRRWQRFCSSGCRRKYHAMPSTIEQLRQEVDELRHELRQLRADVGL